MKFLFLIGVFCILHSARAASTDNSGAHIKNLKNGEVFTFDGHYADGKSVITDVECADISKARSAGPECGSSKNCVTMKPGETTEAGQKKFKCGQ